MKLLNKLKIGYWNVGVIEESLEKIMEDNQYTIRWMKHRYRDRFFADPFLYKLDEKKYYILAEELIFKENKGNIVLLIVERRTMRLVGRRIIINDKFHLSYPNYTDGRIIAENYRSGALYSYTFKGERIEKEMLLNVPVIDPTFVDYNGSKWLFGTTKENEADANQKLSIFCEKDGKYVPHSLNPVKIDVRSSRPGGKFFWFKGELYRPAQNCEHLYGEDIRIMKVRQLDGEKYVEEECKTISSHNCRRFKDGLHTFNVYDGVILVDGFEYEIHPIQKLRNKFAGV